MFGICELCEKPRVLETHHVWGGALRKKSECYRAKARLCVDCHREGKKAVHRDAEQSRKLKSQHQERIMAEYGWDTARFIREFGRNYL
jgi:hypothetical protein